MILRTDISSSKTKFEGLDFFKYLHRKHTSWVQDPYAATGLTGLTGWKAGWKHSWLACYSAVTADDRGSQVKVKAHDWLFCFSCKNLFCFVTKHDLCYFLNTIFVWSKFSTDFHTKLSKYWMSRLAKPPLKLLSLLRFWRQNIGKRLFCYSCKNLALSRKNMTSVIWVGKEIKSLFQFDLIEKYKANLL